MSVFRNMTAGLSAVAAAAVMLALPVAGASAAGQDFGMEVTLLAMNQPVTHHKLVSETAPLSREVLESRFTEPGVLLPASAVKLSSKRSGRVGREIDMAASASGGSRCYEYCFWLEGPGFPGGMSVRGYTSSESWSWEPTDADVGLNTVTVWARCVGSPNEYDAAASYTIEVRGD